MLLGLQITEPNLRVLVERFYGRVRADETLGPIFNNAIGDHWPEHLDTLTAFWSSILLGSGRYKGNPMAAHLPLPRLRPDHLQRWLDLWRATTGELLPPEAARVLQAKAGMMGRRILETVDEYHEQTGQSRA